jgi:MFS family permease
MASAGFFLASGSTVLWLGVINFEWVGYRPILIFAVLQGFGIAGHAISLPILVGRCFGERDFARIIGTVLIGFAVGVIFGSPSMGLIFDKTGSYSLAFVIATVLGAASIILSLLIRTKALHGEFTAP